MELIKRQVQFRILDVYYPDPREIVTKFFGDSVLQGQVLEVTESDRERYAIVRVAGIEETVLIAVNRISKII